MGLPGSDTDDLFQKCRQICSSINIEPKVANNAWMVYENISNNYTLEGEQLQWLGCAIYVVCRKETIPSVSSRPTLLQGLCVSLTKLLRLSGMSVTQFFTKVKLWMEMTKTNQTLRLQVETMEKNFAVSYIIFKKYHPIFADIFSMPKQDLTKQCRLKKGRIYPVNVARIFEFCWTLFLCMRSEYPESCGDLVNSYYLIVSCLNMAFQNTLAIDKLDFFNPIFPGVPEHNNIYTLHNQTDIPNIIQIICERHDGVRLEAKYVNEYCWKIFLKKFVSKGILIADSQTLLGLFNTENFDQNIRNINRAYETYVLGAGVFDERIFLTEFKRVQMLRNPGNDADDENDFENGIDSDNNEEEIVIMDQSEDVLKMENTPIIDGINNTFNFQTPLTGRQYLHLPHFQNSSPAANVNQSISRLQTLLSNCQAHPSENLLRILQKGSQFPLKKIMSILDDIGTRFCTCYTIESELKLQLDHESDFAQKRLNFAKMLYFKLLEAIVNDELKRNPQYNIVKLIENDLFHQSMMACCLEIVIHSYNTQRKFPWILNTLNLAAYYFYRVIELIIRTKESFSREIIKYLNSIEEKTLESIVWEEDSPLWEAIRVIEEVPQCSDVANFYQSSGATKSLSNSFKLVLDSENQRTPIATSSFDKLNATPRNSSIKKRLFSEQNKPTEIQNVVKIATTESSLQTNQTLISESSASNDLNRPRRAGSFALFFRKFYYMAAIRLDDLCSRLDIFDLEMKQKIWTLLEHIIVKETHLLKNRHIDQLVMCSVYVLCKLSKCEKFFTEIMRCYRMQPQATSNVYRNVLLTDFSDDANKYDNEMLTNKYGDLIKFYNTVFIRHVKQFVSMLSKDSNCNGNLVLSPLPLSKPKSSSSNKRKISNNIFIRILSNSALAKRKSEEVDKDQFSYYFNRSPSKALNNINMAVDSKHISKRILLPESGDNVSRSQFITVSNSEKLQSLIEDRALANSHQ